MSFNKEYLDRRIVVDECQRWFRNRWITEGQYKNIITEFGVEPRIESPAMLIGIFAASALIFWGIFGIFWLVSRSLEFAGVSTSIGGILLLETYLARDPKKIFSGIFTSVCWLTCSFGLLAVGVFFESNSVAFYAVSVVVTWAFARRYLSNVAFAACLCFLLMTLIGSLSRFGMSPILELTLIVLVFSMIFFASNRGKTSAGGRFFYDQMRVGELLSLIIILCASNRFLAPLLISTNIAFHDAARDSFMIQTLWVPTLLVPVGYASWAIKTRDVGFMRVSMLALALAAFTIKHFYVSNQLEICLTVAGFALLILSFALNRYLRETRHGFTRKKIVDEEWMNPDAVAIVVAHSTPDQTPMNQNPAPYHGGGGGFSGGGSSGEF